MSKKQYEPPADDWAGLAQNLFGIDLDKSGGDDDLLDKDMFKVEIPPLAEPAAPKVAAESVTFAEIAPARAAEIPASVPVAVAKPAVTKPKAVPSSKPVPAKSNVEDDPFGAGILEEEEEIVAATSEVESFDEGLAQPEDFDDDGLTLASDFDDGLTLPPDHEDDGLTLAADDDDDLTFSSENIASLEEALDGDEDDDDAEDLPVAASDATQAARSESPRKRNPRRTREDAYWDMLENWEWEEIPDSDSPRSGGDRSPVRGGNRDRGGRGGDRGGRSGGDRGGRSGGGDRGGREERPRSAGPARSEERPHRDESRPADAAPTASRSESGDSAARPRRDERPRDDRGPRPERRPDREVRRDEPRPAVASQSATAPKASDDFGSGIFEEQSPPTRTTSVPKPTAPAARPPREEAVAQSSQAADAVLRDSNRATGQSVGDELVWPDDNDHSDVRPAAMKSVVETSGLPAADVAGESDRMVSTSDVEPLDESDQRSRRPRRRRRRGGSPMSDRTAPPDGNEGTAFDLSEALSSDGETPDFIPSASADDSAVSAESAGDAAEDTTGEGPSSQRRGSRRRRRRRPGENAPVDVAPDTNSEVHAESETTEPAEVYEDDEPLLKPIAYSNVPSWEEALRYLLEPHLVGRNLGPDDGDEGLASDPRGSGGAEPTSAPPAPPQRRRRGGSGGGSRGRRP